MTLTQTQPTPLGRVLAGGLHRLLVIYSPNRSDLGYSRAVGGESIVLGRDPGANPSLALRQAEVSRRHAVVEPSESGRVFTLRDLGSRNGTYLNGAVVSSAELTDGDVIRVGATLVLFQFLDAATCELSLDTRVRGRSQPDSISSLIGGGHAMTRLREQIRAAPASAPVLIQGETGVGKERVAEALHLQSGRGGAFVPVNCSALPSNLIESELFGHVRGAFTGAEARKGLYGRADGGTLLLDEIGDLAFEVQAKLLRALAVGEVRPVGADQGRTVDVRVVAATHVELEEAVAAGRFRADLYARLMAYVVTVPPLRERREDILELARHFLREAEGCAISVDAAEALLIHRFPYNVRELEQLLAPVAPVVACRGSLELADLPARLRAPLEARAPRRAVSSLDAPLLSVRREAVPTAEELRSVVEAHGGNVAQVASFFGKDRRQIYRWARSFGVDIQSLRGEAQHRQTLSRPRSSATLPPPHVRVIDED